MNDLNTLRQLLAKAIPVPWRASLFDGEAKG